MTDGPARRRCLKILVIDDDDVTASTIAASQPRECTEIILCRDMAVAEAATDLAEFDLILVSPSATGVDGAGGLAVADFLAAGNPLATTALLLSDEDGDLRRVVERRGQFRVITKPASVAVLSDLVGELRSASCTAEGT